MLNEKQLMSLKQEITDAKQEKSRLEGRLQQLSEQLLKEYGCKTLAEAEKKLKEMDTQIAKLSTTIQEQSRELEEKYFSDDES